MLTQKELILMTFKKQMKKVFYFLFFLAFEGNF